MTKRDILLGVALQSATALLLVDTQVVERSKARELLPKGESNGKGNNVSKAFARTISNLRKRGLIRLLEEGKVEILDRNALLELIEASVVTYSSASLVKHTLDQSIQKGRPVQDVPSETWRQLFSRVMTFLAS